MRNIEVACLFVFLALGHHLICNIMLPLVSVSITRGSHSVRSRFAVLRARASLWRLLSLDNDCNDKTAYKNKQQPSPQLLLSA